MIIAGELYHAENLIMITSRAINVEIAVRNIYNSNICLSLTIIKLELIRSFSNLHNGNFTKLTEDGCFKKVNASPRKAVQAHASPGQRKSAKSTVSLQKLSIYADLVQNSASPKEKEKTAIKSPKQP